MVWMPPSGGGRQGGAADAGRASDASDVPFMGLKRASMATNTLIARSELGKPRKTTFTSEHVEPGHVFGLKVPKQAEGAKQVTMQWAEHKPNPHAQPGPDFRAMNKLAADNGLTGTRGLREFRKGHAVSVKRGAAALGAHKPQPPLPGGKDAAYGHSRTWRSAEDCRRCGPSDPPMRDLVQGAYTHTWVDMNAARAEGECSAVANTFCVNSAL
ncbi:flagellar associated protein [Monoraphidium neglectum]|uniref:Flagellar associated protein n=1 Tax=Monoraphidium neglectum TaxID=145388 RepID=A0A0D2L0I2_9CHLO|nr:flagellar associated protein [Monoraphidium neglectum]KIZ00929.1 flagellar associated protein [Monoraphidium neglectum]|eukprot:XP_013899948.1 flagellar associated protein [Monoraphidium neglectum]